MGYISPGAAAADGIESGVNLGIKVQGARRAEEEYAQRKKDHAEDRSWTLSERERLSRANARTEAQGLEDRDYTMGKRELEAADREAADMRSQLEALAQKAGGFDKVPPADRDRLVGSINQVNARRRQAQEKLYKPIAERYEKQARDTITGLQNGTIDLGSLSDEDTYRAFAGVLRRDPRDALRGPNGEPSKIGGAIQVIMNGFESGDQQGIVDGAAVIMAPELSVGVGSDGPEGTVITGKKLERFVPSPDGKGFIPVIRVEVKGPDGRTGFYYAPVTEGRSSDPKARVQSLDPDKTMDRVGRLGVVEEMLNHPELRAKVERGAAKAGAEAADFFTAISVLGAKPGKFTHSNMQLGDRVVETTRNEAGQPVARQEFQRGVDPNTRERMRAGGINGAGMTILPGEVDDFDAEGNPITKPVNVRVPKAGPAGIVDMGKGVRPAPKPTAPKDPNARDIKQEGENAATQAAAELGYSYKNGTWVDARGRPAPEVDVMKINEARAQALARSEKPGGKADSKPSERKALSQGEVNALREKAKQAIANGKAKAAVENRFKELTGLNL